MSKPLSRSPQQCLGFYRYSSGPSPHDFLLQTLNHLAWEKKEKRGSRAIELGFGAGNDTLELLRRGWRVLAIDQQETAARFLAHRVPARHRGALTTLVAPMEDLELPRADLVYASFSLPFCAPESFPALWANIRTSLRPGGHFAGQLFGADDSWRGDRRLSFYTEAEVRRLARGFRLEMIRETHEEGMSFTGPKHWNYFDLILEKPPR